MTTATTHARTLVLFDGDLPSVLAAAYAAEEAAIPSRRPSLSRVIRGSAGEPRARGDDQALPPLVMPAYFGLPDAPERELALARAIDLLGLERARDDNPDLSGRTELPGEDQTRLLVHAAYASAAAACDRVVWPVQFGEDLRAATPSLDRVSTAIDRELLVSRLVGLDLDRISGGVEIETPFVDLSDRQIAEMVIDIEAPLAACWWWGNSAAAALAAHDRWGTLLRSLGWGGALGPG
jgi:hypothetical protein